MREWYRVQLQADGETAEVQILDIIGDWTDQWLNEMWGEKITVTAKAFVDELAALPESVKHLRVHLNTPGGDVFAAVNIANALRDQRISKGRTVETIVDGIAASAGSLILMAGDPITIADNGLVMIHNPWTVALGNAQELRQAADDLDKYRAANIVPTYQWHSELSAEEIVALMDATTWMDADEAIANGFATQKVEGLKAAASIDPRALARLNVPERFAARVQTLIAPAAAPPAPAPQPTPPAPAGEAEQPPEAAASAEDLVGMCEAAGLDISFASQLLKDRVTLTEAQARVAAEKQRRAVEDRRQTGIRSLCEQFHVGDLAPELISGGMAFDQAKALVAKVRALTDTVEVDPALRLEAKSRPSLNVVDIYAQRNKLRS